MVIIVSLVLFYSSLTTTTTRSPRLSEGEQAREQPDTPVTVQPTPTPIPIPMPSVIIHSVMPEHFHDYTRAGCVVQYDTGNFEVSEGDVEDRTVLDFRVEDVRSQPTKAVIVVSEYDQPTEREFEIALNDPGLEFVRRGLTQYPHVAYVMLPCTEAGDDCHILAVVAIRLTATNP